MARKKLSLIGVSNSSGTITAEHTTQMQQLKTLNLKQLGKNIRRVRIEKNISQRALSDGLFTSAYLSSIELGKTRPTLDTLVFLAERLGVDINYFLKNSPFRSDAGSALNFNQLEEMFLTQRLFICEVALVGRKWEEAEIELARLERDLTGLNFFDQVFFHLLRASLRTSLGNPHQALEELQQVAEKLDAANPTAPLYGETESIGTDRGNVTGRLGDLAGQLDLELGRANHALGNFVKALEHFRKGLTRIKPAAGKVNGFPKRAGAGSGQPEIEYGYWQQELLLGAAQACLQLDEIEAAVGYLELGLTAFTPASQEALAQALLEEARRRADSEDFQAVAFLLGQSREIGQNARKILQQQTLALQASQLHFKLGNNLEARRAAAVVAGLTTTIQPEPGDGEPREAQVYQNEFAALLIMAEISFKEADAEQTQNYLNRAANLLKEPFEIDPFETGRFYLLATRFFVAAHEKEKAYEFCEKGLNLLTNLDYQKSNTVSKSLDPLLAELYYQASHLLREKGETVLGIDYLEKAYKLRSFG